MGNSSSSTIETEIKNKIHCINRTTNSENFKQRSGFCIEFKYLNEKKISAVLVKLITIMNNELQYNSIITLQSYNTNNLIHIIS